MLIALLVGAVHFTLVKTHNLSPWSLGGFGMFSNLGISKFEAYAVEGETVTQIELSRSVLDRIQVLPDTQALERVLAEISCSGEDFPDGTLFVFEFWETRYLRSSQKLVPELRWRGQRAAAPC